MYAIETSSLRKRYKNITAVDGLELTVERGELFSLLGVNGAGKTTVIKMLSCLTRPSAADAKAVGDAIANIELTPGPQGEKGKDGAAGADGLSMYTVSAEPEMESDTGGTVDPGLIDTGGRTLTAGDLLLSPGGKVYRVLQAADTVICSVSFFADLHGSDGLTPVKGTDYWTEADKAELVDAVLAALPAAEEVSF